MSHARGACVTSHVPELSLSLSVLSLSLFRGGVWLLWCSCCCSLSFSFFLLHFDAAVAEEQKPAATTTFVLGPPDQETVKLAVVPAACEEPVKLVVEPPACEEPVEHVVEPAACEEPVAQLVVETAPCEEPMEQLVVETAPCEEPVEHVVEPAACEEPVEHVVEPAACEEPVAQLVVETAPCEETVEQLVVETAPCEETVKLAVVPTPCEEPVKHVVEPAACEEPVAQLVVETAACEEPVEPIPCEEPVKHVVEQAACEEPVAFVTPRRRKAESEAHLVLVPNKRLRSKTTCSLDMLTPLKVFPQVVRAPVPPMVEVPDLWAFAADVKKKFGIPFERLARLQASMTVKSCSKGKVPDAITSCRLCDKMKHEVKWLIKDGRCTGGLCYTCYRTAVYLQCSRSPDCIILAEALNAFQEVSKMVRLSLGSSDTCICKACK